MGANGYVERVRYQVAKLHQEVSLLFVPHPRAPGPGSCLLVAHSVLPGGPVASVHNQGVVPTPSLRLHCRLHGWPDLVLVAGFPRTRDSGHSQAISGELVSHQDSRRKFESCHSNTLRCQDPEYRGHLSLF